MSREQARTLDNATAAARLAAAGKADLSIAERLYTRARLDGVPRDELAPARRYLRAARAMEA